MATSSRATQPGTLRLSEVARKVSQPSGIVSTAWPDVERTCRRMGVEFDEWQRGAGHAKLIGATSLLLWIGIVAAGRWIAYS